MIKSKNKHILLSFSMALLLIFGSNNMAFAATMTDDWFSNPYIGWNHITSGGIVLAAQKILNSAGMSLKVPTFTKSDGYYGDATNKAVYQYQEDYKLSQDGIIGSQTWTSFHDHLYYTGNSGSIQRYSVQYNPNWATTYFERDYLNGWCVKADSTGTFYICKDSFTKRTIIPS